MRIFAIADLHFDFKKEKPMDVFGDNWENHEEKIIENWKNTVDEEDLVLIPGDISVSYTHLDVYKRQQEMKIFQSTELCKACIESKKRREAKIMIKHCWDSIRLGWKSSEMPKKVQ